jgi:hypothetical protein
VVLATLAAMGCSAELEPYSADAESGSTHALVSIERSAASDGSERAQALATFVQLPAEADARAVLESVGLKPVLPALGQCVAGAATAPSYRGSVELIQAGDVNVTAAGTTTVLAPHAFPTVTDVVSGIVYTTRDQSAAPFPTATDYTLKVDGELGNISVTRRAPSELTAVTVNGMPLSEAGEISAAEPMDLTWSVGAPGDRLWVEVATADGSLTLCSFRDDLGAATIAGGSLGAGAARVALHRVRVAEFSAPGIALGELRFDFELTGSLSIVP